MTEPEPLYHRLIDASNGKLANLAEARRLIAEAIGALSRAQAEIDRLHGLVKSDA